MYVCCDMLVAMKKAPLFSFKYFLYDFARINGWPLLLWYRPKKVYISKEAKKPLKGGLILMSNHISLKDPLYIQVAVLSRRHHFVAAKELFKNKFNHWLFKYMFLCIEIDRDNFSISKLKEINKHLEIGEMITMFPEGHVNVQPEEINQFKGGIVMMAYKTHSPIVPIYITKRKHWWNRLTVFMGEQIDVNAYLKDKSFNVNTIKEVSEYLESEEKELELLCNNYKKHG